MAVVRTNINRPQSDSSITAVQTLADLGFTATEIAKATRAWITAHDGDLVYSVNGLVPTATKGHVFQQDQSRELTESVRSLKLISKSGSAVVTTVELETTP